MICALEYVRASMGRKLLLLLCIPLASGVAIRNTTNRALEIVVLEKLRSFIFVIMSSWACSTESIRIIVIQLRHHRRVVSQRWAVVFHDAWSLEIADKVSADKGKSKSEVTLGAACGFLKQRRLRS